MEAHKKIVGEPLGVTSVGLDPFIARLQATEDVDQEAVSTHIGEVWQNLLLSGTRLVKLYKLEPEEVQTLRENINALERDESVFAKAIHILCLKMCCLQLIQIFIF